MRVGRTLCAVAWRLLATGVELRVSREPVLGDNPVHERRLRAAEAAGEVVYVDAGTFAELEVDGGLERIGGAQSLGNEVALGRDPTSRLLEIAEMAREVGDALSHLRIAGFKISRWEFYAAPSRLELEAELAARLEGSWDEPPASSRS